MRGGSRLASMSIGLLLLALLSTAPPLAGVSMRSGAALAQTGGQSDSGDEIYSEYVRQRAVNAVLRARLTLSKEALPYLILDLPEQEMRLELQGVILSRFPARKVRLNHLAKEISRDTTRIAFCEVPFELQHDRWFEKAKTLALKDTSAVMSSPDTTGALAEAIRTSPILALLRFDRNLAVALNGDVPPESLWERVKKKVRSWWNLYRKGTPEGSLRVQRRDTVSIELEMEPAEIRSLAPNLTEGTRLVLRF